MNYKGIVLLTTTLFFLLNYLFFDRQVAFSLLEDYVVMTTRSLGFLISHLIYLTDNHKTILSFIL